MKKSLFMLVAFISLLMIAQEEMDPREFAKRLQTEIADCRQKADTIRKATEDDWQRHTGRVQTLQKETDELARQMELLTEEIENLQQANQEAAVRNALAKQDEQRFAQLLPQNDNASLSVRLEQLTQDHQASLEQLFLSPQATAITAKDNTGRQMDGSAIHFGPVSVFMNQDGYGQLFDGTDGSLPNVPKITPSISQEPVLLDITGKHPELFTQSSSLLKHLRQGGVIMIPILLLGAVCILVMLCKMMELAIHRPSQDLRKLEDAAKSSAKDGVALEDELFNIAQRFISRREHLLFWLGVSATAAPLLGLLGTVTGMIHTFRLITIFGIGDARLLADGISEALITTEAGLCVAIPALLCHAWLTRLARRHATVLETYISSLTTEKKTEGTEEA